LARPTAPLQLSTQSLYVRPLDIGLEQKFAVAKDVSSLWFCDLGEPRAERNQACVQFAVAELVS
jgi:hypothetical protein